MSFLCLVVFSELKYFLQVPNLAGQIVSFMSTEPCYSNILNASPGVIDALTQEYKHCVYNVQLSVNH